MRKSYPIDHKKLDNPAWYSLTETHQSFAIDYKGAKFYQPQYCPFGAFINLADTRSALDAYSLQTNNFYIIGNLPNFSEKIMLIKELVCKQMVLFNLTQTVINEDIINLLSAKQRNDLANLVNLVQPGYFKSDTPLMGNYYGIYKDNKLVAVAGERMKMHGYTEVSAVVTDPGYTGKGYAKQLVSHTCKKIIREDKTPYLHVTETNENAIRLYEKSGFETRRKISFWNFGTNNKTGVAPIS